jgi:hypothetical protein
MLRDGVWLVEVKRSVAVNAPSVDDVDVASGADVDETVAKPDTQDSAVSDASLTPPGTDMSPTEDIDLAHAATLPQPAPKRRGGRPKGSRNKPKVVE